MKTQLPIAEASLAQLKAFAETMQLDLGRANTEAKVRAVLAGAWSENYIVVDDEQANAEQAIRAKPLTQKVAGPAGSNDPIVVLKIAKTAYPGGKDPIPVSVNGRALVLQRDMQIELPYRFYEALQKAIRQEVSQDVNTGEITVDDVTNYPIQPISFPTAAEIAAWEEATNDEVFPD